MVLLDLQRVAFCVRRVVVMLVVFAGILGVTYFGLVNVPTGFVPAEDDGLVLLNVQMPSGASLQRTEAMTERIGEILKNTEGVTDFAILGGYSIFDGNGANLGAGFASLAPWREIFFFACKGASDGRIENGFDALTS